MFVRGLNFVVVVVNEEGKKKFNDNINEIKYYFIHRFILLDAYFVSFRPEIFLK